MNDACPSLQGHAFSLMHCRENESLAMQPPFKLTGGCIYIKA